METNNKPLTEADLIVGNKFECIKSDSEYGISMDNIYCCENKSTITTITGIVLVQDFDWFNLHFKLLPTTQEFDMVKAFEEYLNNTPKEQLMSEWNKIKEMNFGTVNPLCEQQENPYKVNIEEIVDKAFEQAKVKAQEESVNGEDEEDEAELLSDSERESEIAKFKAYPFDVRPGRVEDEIDHAKREIYKRGFKEGFEMANQKILSIQQENDKLKDELNKYKLAHSLYANPCGFCGQIKCICHQPLI